MLAGEHWIAVVAVPPQRWLADLLVMAAHDQHLHLTHPASPRRWTGPGEPPEPSMASWLRPAGNNL